MSDESAGQRVAARRIGADAVRRGVLANVLGTLLPALAALLCIRWMLDGLGLTRFGVLTLAWAFINSVGLLDLGIGRALTRVLAVGHEPDARREGHLIWTSLAAMAALGLCGAVIAWLFSRPLALLFLRGAPDLVPETESALKILSLSIPLVIVSSGLRGILEAGARFDLINRVSIPTALLNLIVPVVLLRWQIGLPGIVAALVVVRLGASAGLLAYCLRATDSMRHVGLSATGMRPVAGFAGWVAVSNATGPFFGQVERFLLGALVSPAAVAFYSTPADLLSRLTIVPSAVLQVLFPVLAQSVHSEPDRAGRILAKGSFSVLGATLPLAFILTAIAPEALTLWLGADFAEHAAFAARVLAAGVFVNCMVWLPFSLIQSAGRADLTGKLHLIEIPFHFALTALLVYFGGVDGAALAVLLRSSLDALVVGWLAARLAPRASRGILKLLFLIGCGCVMLALLSLPFPLAMRGSLAVAFTLATAAFAWFWFLDGDGRGSVLAEVSSLRDRIAGSLR